MRTVVIDPATSGFEELLERRRRSGLDRLDEVWKGVLHMVPAPTEAHARIQQQLAEILGPLARAAGLIATMNQFNLGDGEEDFRVPDGGLHRRSWGTWAATAALTVEVVSPGDESWQKLPFYAARGVDEVLVVDPGKRSVDWLALRGEEYRSVECSCLIAMRADQLEAQLDWPETIY